MAQIDPNLFLLLIAALYVLVFGGLSILRREGLSAQFALEGGGHHRHLGGGRDAPWRAPQSGSSAIAPIRADHALEVAGGSRQLAWRSGASTAAAFRIYDLSLALRPDTASRLIVLSNRGAAELHSGQVARAVQTLEGVMDPHVRPNLGVRCEAVTRYNLGLAYDQNGQLAQALEQFGEAADLLPGSPAARAARAALDRRRKS